MVFVSRRTEHSALRSLLDRLMTTFTLPSLQICPSSVTWKLADDWFIQTGCRCFARSVEWSLRGGGAIVVRGAMLAELDHYSLVDVNSS